LPFEWGALAQRWGGVEGLDWHRREARNVGDDVAQPVVSRPAAKRDAKQRLIALVEDFFGDNWHDLTSRETLEWGDVATTENGNTSIRYRYRAKIGDKDSVTNDQIFTFDPQDKFVSVKDVKGR
jgi:hypothetical protein